MLDVRFRFNLIINQLISSQTFTAACRKDYDYYSSAATNDINVKRQQNARLVTKKLTFSCGKFHHITVKWTLLDRGECDYDENKTATFFVFILCWCEFNLQGRRIKVLPHILSRMAAVVYILFKIDDIHRGRVLNVRDIVFVYIESIDIEINTIATYLMYCLIKCVGCPP